MKAWLTEFLLGRGLSKAQELVSKAVRHGLTTAGGALVANGYATGDDIATLQGAAVVAVGIGMSIARTFLAKYIKEH